MLGAFTNYVFLGMAQQRLYQSGPVILTYHRMGTPPAWAPDPFLYDTPSGLSAHLMRAKAAGLRFATLGEATSGGNLQPNTLVVTFDDGCVSVLEQGLPVLLRHQVRAIQFIVAGRIGGRNDWDLSKDDVPSPLMDEVQIREWLAAGQEIGSHTMTHKNLRKVSPAVAREEIFSSKKRLEDLFGVPVRHLAFPYGGWRAPHIREMIQEAGYLSASTTQFGVSISGTELWSLKRITPLTDSQLVEKIWHRLLRKARSGVATRW
jgi:peptidoglycan/xylan/chitin deacetylase (PgdA/CDA1 family)